MATKTNPSIKKNFREACEESNAISVDAFFNELDERIKKRFRRA